MPWSDDATPADCVAGGAPEAYTLAMAEMAEQSAATKTAGASVGDLVTLPE